MKQCIATVTVFAISLSFTPVKTEAAELTTTADHIYVETNYKIAHGNSIAAFTRHSDGQVTEIPGSPFQTGGEGTQYAGVGVGPQDSDQNIITNADHTLLFAVNSGSDTIAVFHIHGDGSLTPVAGSPFPSGGNDPVSLDLVGSTLFVVNKSGDLGRPSAVLPNYVALRLRSNGSLVRIDPTINTSSHALQSTVSVAAGSSPSQALVVPGTNLLFGADFLGGLIQRFRFEGDGELQQLSPIALPASEFADTTTPRLPLGLWYHPFRPLLYVGYVTDARLGIYEYDGDGGLSLIRTVPNSGAGICWLRTNRGATRLYSSETGTNSIGVYDLKDPEEPVQMQEFNLSGLGNVLQFSLSTDGKSLYALSSRGSTAIPEGQGNELHILTIREDGTVAENQPPVTLTEPADTRPQGIAVIPANQ